MNDAHAKVRYEPIPELSPYVRHDRYERPKEIFKHLARKLASVTRADRRYRYADLACANGELLYHLRKRFAHWQLEGYDITPEFIEAGRAFPGLAGIELHVQDLYAIEDRFDIVSLINLMTVIGDPEETLLHLISLVEPGGLLLVDGCFNVHDVEFRGLFMDNSRPESEGKWRSECNQHSRTSIARILEGRCRSFEFEDVVMNVGIPRRPEAPHADVWTFKDEHGRNIITNGTNMMMNKSLLTVYL